MPMSLWLRTYVIGPTSRKVGFGRAIVHYVDNEYVARRLWEFATWLRGGTQTAWSTATALSYPSYLAFEWEVWKSFRGELRGGRFEEADIERESADGKTPTA